MMAGLPLFAGRIPTLRLTFPFGVSSSIACRLEVFTETGEVYLPSGDPTIGVDPRC